MNYLFTTAIDVLLVILNVILIAVIIGGLVYLIT